MTVTELRHWVHDNHFEVDTYSYGGNWGASLYGAWAGGIIALTTKVDYATKGLALRGLVRLFSAFVRALPKGS